MKAIPSSPLGRVIGTTILALTGFSLLTLTSCTPDYPRGHRGYHNHAPRNYYPGPRKLKPKEKARLGFGRHAGHPHGGPPGQRKKLRW